MMWPGDASMDGQKVPEQARAHGGGTLGMELRAVKIAPLHTGAEGRAIAGAGDGGGAHAERVAVHEIRAVAVGKTREQRAGTPYLEGIPAHARHRPIGAAFEQRGAAGDDAEAAGIAFLRPFVQELHSD